MAANARYFEKIRSLLVCPSPLTKSPGIFAVLDSSKSVDSTDCGMIVSLYKSITAARKAATKVKHSRVLQLKTQRRDWAVGDHVDGKTQVIFSNTARFG